MMTHGNGYHYPREPKPAPRFWPGDLVRIGDRTGLRGRVISAGSYSVRVRWESAGEVFVGDYEPDQLIYAAGG
jgi:hypothetical protein